MKFYQFKDNSFNGEANIQMYIREIFEFIVLESRFKDQIKAFLEFQLIYDGFKTVKPDITLFFNRGNQEMAEAHVQAPIFIVEVKNLEDKKSQNLLDHLP